MTAPLCALSVDLDGIACYRAIHGLPERDEGKHAVYDVALERIAAFADGLQIPLTLFVIGRDLARARSADNLLRFVGRHCIENHSQNHLYDLTERHTSTVAREIRRASDAIEGLCGRRPAGFRAPGYLLDDRMLDALEVQGFRYDASLFPSAPYMAAKRAAMGWMSLWGRESAAIASDAAVALAPRDPYRPGRPYHQPGERELVEIPITVTRRARLPVIGTSLSLAGRRGARWLARGCIGRPVISFEMHGVDFLDRYDGLEDLVPHQRDLRLAHHHKTARYADAVRLWRDAGYRFVTLEQAAEELHATL